MEGTYYHSIDAKGRLFIPARLREYLGNPFYATLSIGNYVSAYSCEEWDAFKAKVKALPKVKQSKLRTLFANAQRCDIDGQGRVLLTQYLRDKVGLTKNVAIVGNCGCVEIWDAEEYKPVDKDESTSENIRAAYEEIGI